MAGKWLPAAELTGSGRPVLHPGEVECSFLSSVDLECEENPSFPLFKFGLLIITTHRILWIPDATTPTHPHAATNSGGAGAIPLSAVSRIFSSKKSIKSMFASPRVRLQVSATPEGSVDERGSRSMVITLVLRGKSDWDSFLGKLWEAWRGRAWESSGPSGSELGKIGPADVPSSSGGLRMPVVGVSGILRKEQEMWESTDKSLQEAFHDLNALMSKAKEMVMLAEKMRQKLLSGSNNQAFAANDEEMGSKEEMQDWLLSVGIASPVTKESAGALYHQQLSRQLADFVKIPLERAGGMMNLIDIYCLFNRARGTELISPEDLLQACSIWEKFDVPVMLRKFDSGVMVIQNKSYRDEEVFSRIKSLVLKPEALRFGISASDAAITLGIAPAMAKEHLLTAENKGLLCRDISPDGFRFYVNLFQEIDRDDVYLVKDHGTYSSWVTAAFFSRLVFYLHPFIVWDLNWKLILSFMVSKLLFAQKDGHIAFFLYLFFHVHLIFTTFQR
ncbi:Vacuolar protein-sorting-associated protein 36 [Sarracenia purpurea var. burkii]